MLVYDKRCHTYTKRSEKKENCTKRVTHSWQIREDEGNECNFWYRWSLKPGFSYDYQSVLEAHKKLKLMFDY